MNNFSIHHHHHHHEKLFKEKKEVEGWEQAGSKAWLGGGKEVVNNQSKWVDWWVLKKKSKQKRKGR